MSEILSALVISPYSITTRRNGYLISSGLLGAGKHTYSKIGELIPHHRSSDIRICYYSLQGGANDMDSGRAVVQSRMAILPQPLHPPLLRGSIHDKTFYRPGTYLIQTCMKITMELKDLARGPSSLIFNKFLELTRTIAVIASIS